MPKLQKDKLVSLINSLTKAEKRSFRLYVNRNVSTSDSLFVQLFNLIAKQNDFDEEKILKKIPALKKSQISNLKANLFKQILTCLRLIERSKYEEIQVREQIDYAKILYERGMYKSCLEILDKAKRQAFDIDYETLALSIIYFEKRIESQHVTGSMASKADELCVQSSETLKEITLTNQLSNASLLLYGEYLRHGYTKNKEDHERMIKLFNSLIPDHTFSELKFYQKLYLFQSYVWFYNTTQDFPNYYKYAFKWVDLFRENKSMRFSATSQYVKGVHNLLNSIFMTGRRQRFNDAYKKFLEFDIQTKPHLTQNDVSMYYLIKYIQLLNGIFLNGDYSSDESPLIELDAVLKDNTFGWDPHRILVFNHKLGCVYFGRGNLDKCIFYLNKITNNNIPEFRTDIQSFSRILNLIAHFDLGNEELVSYQIKSLYRFLSKLKELQKVQLEIIKFLRKTTTMQASKMNEEFILLKDRLIEVEREEFEKRPFLYLDIISWLESKIQNKSMKEIIQLKIVKNG
jgi:tetratricopeptide (TPR) repeat protein